MENYYNIKGVNFSTLKYLLKSDAQYLHALNTTFEPTKSMIFGSAVHEKIADVINKTDNFNLKYIELDETKYFAEADLSKRGFKNTKKYKEKISELSKGREIVQPLNFIDNILTDQNIKNRIEGAVAESEYFLSIQNKEGISDLLKAKMDIVNVKKSLILDWKTTSEIPTPRNMQRMIMKYNYWLQAAFYSYILKHAEKQDFNFIFVFIQNTEPYEFNYIEVNGPDFWHLLKPLINRAILLKNGKAQKVKKELTSFEMPFNPIENINLEL